MYDVYVTAVSSWRK